MGRCRGIEKHGDPCPGILEGREAIIGGEQRKSARRQAPALGEREAVS